MDIEMGSGAESGGADGADGAEAVGMMGLATIKNKLNAKYLKKFGTIFVF